MTSYKELIAKRDALEAQINEARRSELSLAVSKVQELISEFGLTAEDVFGTKRRNAAGSTSKKPAAAKYRDPATGITWSGRGRAPTWIIEKDRDQFVV